MNSSKNQESAYIEGVHRFVIDEGYLVCRVECSEYYFRSAQNFCGGCKEMDFLLYHPKNRDLWLIEVKDYRFDARPKVRELVDALCKKVRDTLFLLKSAALCAPQEYPLEGVSLRDFARQAQRAKSLHLGFLLEMGATGAVMTDGGMLANIKNLLLRSMKFLDAELLCSPITHTKKVGPWVVSDAHGEVSKRVELRRAKKAAEIERIRHQIDWDLVSSGASCDEDAHHTRHKKRPHQDNQKDSCSCEPKVPLWKRRVARRLENDKWSIPKKRRHRYDD